MSRRYKGARISATPPTISASSASGVWTLQQEMQAIETAWPFGGPYNYIEDVFSTYLYTGTGTTQTITNNINLSGNGGLLWIKARNVAYSSALFDTARTSGNYIASDTTGAQGSIGGGFSIGTTGFTVNGATFVGESAKTYVSWSFRKQSKFFDVVTYTGNGTTQTISHSLGSRPGLILCKSTSAVDDWAIWHRGNGTTGYTEGSLNSVNGATSTTDATIATTTNFKPSSIFTTNVTAANTNGVTYVAYIFAHNAGGFGTSNQDNVISCGTFSNDSSGHADITLGYEPQFVMIKSTSTASNWIMLDTMRNWNANGVSADNPLYASAANLEGGVNYGGPSANGFFCDNLGVTINTWIYLAVRRGPMAVPTSATSVFTNNIGTDTSAQTTNFPVDMVWDANPGGSSININIQNRLFLQYAASSSNAAAATGNTTGWNSNTQITPGIFGAANCIMNSFRRAPKFFDVTTYVGNPSVAFTVYHNLGAIPELLITKCTSTTGEWWVQYSFDSARDVFLNTNAAQGVYGYPFTLSSSTTSTLFFNTFGSNIDPCKTGATYIVYLFATLAGISKVGTYTGTGALQTVNCGFTSGARFILIKRLSGATGDWYVYNSASGISASTDPFMNTNNTSAQTTGTDYVDTDTTGFKLNAAGSATVNVSGAPYIFLAIA